MYSRHSVLRRTIVNRSYGIDKNQYIYQFSVKNIYLFNMASVWYFVPEESCRFFTERSCDPSAWHWVSCTRSSIRNNLKKAKGTTRVARIVKRRERRTHRQGERMDSGPSTRRRRSSSSSCCCYCYFVACEDKVKLPSQRPLCVRLARYT